MGKVEVVENENVNNSNPAWKGIAAFVITVAGSMFFMHYVNNSTINSTTNSVDHYQYNYTAWKNTDGYVIQILDNDCVVGKDGKEVGNICTFEANAGGTGVAKITVCNRYGSDCDSTELQYQSALRESFYVFGNTWYYNGKVEKN